MASSRDDQLEKIVGRVKDVLRAKVIRDEGGSVREVRVLTNEAKSVQKITRDVASAIRSQGEEVDAGSIRISQMANEDWSEIAGARLKLKSVSFESSVSAAESRVTLVHGDQAIYGVAAGSASSKESLRIVARATLEAAKSCIDPSPGMFVEGVIVADMINAKVVLVLVSVFGPDGVEYLSGSCPVRIDDRDATARATLSAINRKFALLVRGND
ncbi:MAG: hypothetical protein Q8P50_13950 [Bacillota bacterium]|nr:hypothetical protein [Bacillota bacterium]